MSRTMLALNAGSSSIKFGLFDMTGARPVYLFAGEISDTGHKPHLAVKDMQGRSVLERDWPHPGSRRTF
jgi:acetate kinase